MQLNIIRNDDEFMALAGEWNHLLKESASHVPFLRHEYLLAWWRSLGGGEWQHGDLYLITARSDNGTLCGITPLFLTENHQGQAAMMLLGSFEISDYLDIIVLPDCRTIFIDKMLEHLGSPSAPAWQVLEFYNLLDSSPTLPALAASAERLGWTYRQEHLQHCPSIPLLGDWEIYLAGIDKKQRHEIRRKMRRLDALSEARWYILEDESNLEQGIEDMFSLMANDPDKQAFLTAAMRSHLGAVMRTAFKAGWLQLAFLEINGEPAAGYLNFDYGNHIWVYNSGMNYNLGSYSPGWVLLGHLLKWANEHGFQSFDFMRGDEDYKYRFGGIDRMVVRVVITRA